MAAALYMVYGAQIIINRVTQILDLYRVSKTLFHKKKAQVNDAAAAMKRCVNLLDSSFDGVFNDIWNKVPGEEAERFDSIEWFSHQVIRFMLVFLSRADGNMQKQENMLKALMNFKEDEKMNFDLAELIKIYELK